MTFKHVFRLWLILVSKHRPARVAPTTTPAPRPGAAATQAVRDAGPARR